MKNVTPRLTVLLIVAIVAVSFAAIINGCGGSEPANQVTLQLNWYHEAEFVGYYVAEAKGFYDEQGLDVTILEGGPPSDPAREAVLNETATFAIAAFGEQRDLVADGRPSVAVMSAFQIPPLVIFSLAKDDITRPSDLVGKNVGTTTDYWRGILEDTLIAAGVDPTTVTTVEVTPDQMSLLFEGTVQAWLGYAQDEPIRAEVAGYPVNNIYPADYGIGGYEGLLITLQKTIDEQPDLVKRFVQASYEGWRYALEQQDEAAEILDTWAPDNGLQFQQFAVRAVAPLVDTPQVPVGWIDAQRWQQLMGDAYDPARPGFTMDYLPVTP